MNLEYMRVGIDLGLCRKQLQFSLLNPQDVVKLSEFQVTHRDLYTATDRAPVKDGVLDRRLASAHVCCVC